MKIIMPKERELQCFVGVRQQQRRLKKTADLLRVQNNAADINVYKFLIMRKLKQK